MSDLEKYIPDFVDVSEWDRKPYVTTGGTRSKNIVIDEYGAEWFIKGSKVLKDGTIRYPLEFWSEIVSSKIGQLYGFHMLDYNIAWAGHSEKQPVQCISKSMIEHDKSTLTEGISYLKGHMPSYNPQLDESEYSVLFIESALRNFNLSGEFPKLIETLFFDALIGNSDRHSENWAFISDYSVTLKELEELRSRNG